MIEHQEALHPRPLDQELAVRARPRGRRLARSAVGNADGAADDDPGADVDPLQHGVGDRPADVVEVDVDARRAGFGDRAAEVRRRLVVHRRVIAEVPAAERGLLVRAGQADRAATLEPGDLPDHGADRPRRGRDHHRLPGLGPADLGQPEVGGEAGVAQDVERGRDRRLGGIELAVDVPAVGERPFAPALAAQDEVPRRVVRMPGSRDLTHGEADHDRAQGQRLAVVRRLGDPASHGRVQREVDHPDQKLSRSRLRPRRRLQAEAVLPHPALGARDQQDLMAGVLRHGYGPAWTRDDKAAALQSRRPGTTREPLPAPARRRESRPPRPAPPGPAAHRAAGRHRGRSGPPPAPRRSRRGAGLWPQIFHLCQGRPALRS